jgi:2,3-bisphosphoglycerate-independent phosphoglycerate mutase
MTKYVILQADGMPDHPVPELGNLTPLEYANTPNLDEFAKRSLFGTASTIPKELPPGSDVGNLSVLGYDPRIYYTGRSPLEAASMGVELTERDVSYRCNLVTLLEKEGDLIMDDYSAGHISTEEARELIEALKRSLSGDGVDFFPGVSYRHLMRWRDGSDAIKTTPPHDISGRAVAPYLPSGKGAERLLYLMKRSQEVLKDHPVNLRRMEEGKKPATSIWLWGAGRPPTMPTFESLYGVRGAVISAVDLVKGIGVYAGLRVINVPGATGYLDTNYEGKVSAALSALSELDLVMIHIEATDETGHEGKPELKVRAVEDFDSRVVAPIMDAMPKRFKHYRVMILSDHPTPLDIRTHANEPVPFGIFDSREDGVRNPEMVYTEKAAARTGIHVEEGWGLMEILLRRVKA